MPPPQVVRGEAEPRAPLPQVGCEVGGMVRAHSAPTRRRPLLGGDAPTVAEVAAAAAAGTSLSKRGMSALCASVLERAEQSADGRGAGWGGGGANGTALWASAVLPRSRPLKRERKARPCAAAMRIRAKRHPQVPPPHESNRQWLKLEKAHTQSFMTQWSQRMHG